MRRTWTILLAAACVSAGCGGNGADDRAPAAAPTAEAPAIRLGTKNFTEQYILGELYAQALRARGFRVELKPDIGSTEIIDGALSIGSLDMYPEYTGVQLSEIAGRTKRPASARDAYRQASEFQKSRGFTLLAMTPFSDRNALAVKPAFARRHRLRTLRDLARVPGSLWIAAPPEFRTRFEGLVGLRRIYGLDRLRVKPVPLGEQYAALDKGDVDIASVLTTDGQLVGSRYRVLRDPENLFGFQNVAPIVSTEVVQRLPGMAEVVDAVSAKLTTEAMQTMNGAVALDDRPPAEVAREFLRASGLL